MVADIREQIAPKLGKIFHNHQWLTSCFGDEIQVSFPYIPDTGKGAATIDKTMVDTFAQNSMPLPLASLTDREVNEIGFVINIPLLFDVHTNCTELLKKIRNEGFGTTAAESRPLIRKQVAVVIGLNRMKSLDSEKNAEISAYVEQLQEVSRIHYRVFPFLWAPKWGMQLKFDRKLLYSKEKCFRLFKLLNPDLASRWLTMVEVKNRKVNGLAEQMNMQQIRETIKVSAYTQTFFDAMVASDAPVYFTMMDGDTRSLRASGEGAFSVANRRIQEYLGEKEYLPSVYSSGYFADQTERPLTQLAIKIDMAVRAATATVIPQGPYYPEPFTCVQVDDLRSFRKLSFLGNGEKLESRRFIESGIRYRIIEPERMLFIADPCFTTTIPKRLKPTHHDEVDVLSRAKIGQKSIVTAFGGVKQSHVFPRLWANEIYPILPITTAVTTVTAPMMYLFGVFNPLKICRSIPETLNVRYHQKYFSLLLNHYAAYAEYIDTQNQLTELVNRFGKNAEEKRNYRNFFRSKVQEVEDQKILLRNVGLSERWVTRVYLAAKASGAAIHRTLLENTR